MLMLYYSLKREPTQRTTLWRLKIHLKSRLGSWRVTGGYAIAIKNNISYYVTSTLTKPGSHHKMSRT